MLRRPKRFAIVFAVMLVSVPAASQAANPEIAKALDRLFEVGSSSSFSSRQAADEQFESVKQMAVADSRIAYAFAVVKINQGQYKDADSMIRPLAAREDADLHLLRSRIWLSTMLKDYAATLLHLDRLSEQLAAAESPDPNVVEQSSRFMGRVIAFLEGPAGSAANARLVASTRDKIVARLGETDRNAFEDAYQAITDQFLALTETKEEAAARAEREAVEKREATLNDLDEQRQRIDSRREDLRSQRERLQSEYADQMNATAKADQPLVAQLGRLQTQAAAVTRELASIDLELARLDSLIANETDPFIRDQYIRESSRLAIISRRYRVDLSGIERQASVVAAQRVELQRQRIETERTIGNQLKDAAKELGELDQQNKRTDAIERRARRPAGTSNQTRAISAQAAAFTTYEPFPYEQERQRILQGYK